MIWVELEERLLNATSKESTLHFPKANVAG
ncbi:hypothetical protein AWB69_05618 [Caballeronia udeis]|uniref:Uncharacterized protein n=1 Tax=Caballeronia udeis TaxID=1232866 RepID=A0A158IA28_9BURK|nr:hypothetical protein AWB69_05618 [Caballeronia udeis]